jgi:hypothetical protein
LILSQSVESKVAVGGKVDWFEMDVNDVNIDCATASNNLTASNLI